MRMKTRNKLMRVLLGLSGGLDSSFAAHRLKSEGYSVTGAALLMHDSFDPTEAEKTAELLGIPFVLIDCKDRFERIKDNFVSEYSHGRTPNPCVICNAEVKLRMLYEYALKEGYDYISTGHYAKICKDEHGRVILSKSRDLYKDQSYMLHRVSEDILDRLLLPLSYMTKAEARDSFRECGLDIFDRPESQEICFIPDGDYPGFIEHRLGRKFPDGEFLSDTGAHLGTHKGIIRYTVGQRKGLGVSSDSRLFVKEIRPADSTIILDSKPPLASEIFVRDFVSFSYAGLEEGREYRLLAQVRYRAKAVRCTLTLEREGKARVRFDTPVSFVCPGQSVVLYDNDRVVGGGFIEYIVG